MGLGFLSVLSRMSRRPTSFNECAFEFMSTTTSLHPLRKGLGSELLKRAYTRDYIWGVV